MDLEKQVSKQVETLPTALPCRETGNLWASVFKDRTATLSILEQPSKKMEIEDCGHPAIPKPFLLNLRTGRNSPRAVRIALCCATYPAYFCPLHCGGAVSHSRLLTTILHSECGDCKSLCEHLTTNLGSPARRPSKSLPGKTARTKKRNEGLSIGP